VLWARRHRVGVRDLDRVDARARFLGGGVRHRRRRDHFPLAAPAHPSSVLAGTGAAVRHPRVAPRPPRPSRQPTRGEPRSDLDDLGPALRHIPTIESRTASARHPRRRQRLAQRRAFVSAPSAR
jgi:hypothetical protein